MWYIEVKCIKSWERATYNISLWKALRLLLGHRIYGKCKYRIRKATEHWEPYRP